MGVRAPSSRATSSAKRACSRSRPSTWSERNGQGRLRGPRSRWCTSITSTGSPSMAAAMESGARQSG
ncbi:uncharacterized protein ACA1_045920, partial [Acanthamoeba castellanii str. Neff]